MKMILPKGYMPAKTLVMGTLLTGKFDLNRQECLPKDDFSLVKSWVDSILELGLNAVLFHNHLSPATCKAHQHKKLTFVKVEHDTRYNANIYRYFVYEKFLTVYPDHLDSFFVTDVSDVVLVQNPFIQPLFVENPTSIFCGDEPKVLGNTWMQNHGTHLRAKIDNYASFEAKFHDYPLLNCGIIGGSAPLMRQLIQRIAEIHSKYNGDNNTAFTGDMGAFNYILRTQFGEKIKHGFPVNTNFKAYEVGRNDCWFRHK